MDETETAPEAPQRTPISSRADLAAALLTLIGRARRQLRFAAADLSVFALSDIAPVEALRQMLLAGPRNQVRILVDDMTWLDARAPRLRSLQRTFPTSLLIRGTDPQERVMKEVLAVGDERDALQLKPTVGVIGDLWCDNGAIARPQISEFDRRWEHASHNQPSKPLGL